MKKLLLALSVLVFIACEDDNKVESDKAELLDFKVQATNNFTPEKTFIDSENGEIQVFNNTDFEVLDFPITLNTDISVSPGATVEPASGTSVTFSDPEDFVKYIIVSEDGVNVTEYIFTIRDMQLPSAGFENWHMEIGMNGKPFEQPGKYLESTIWATANMGTSIYSIYGTSPVKEGNNTVVKIETVTTVALPVVAAALYVGDFNLDGAIEDPTNPVAAAKLGIPFYKKPTAVEFKYSYKAGDQLVQAVLKEPGNLFGGFDVYEIDGKDKFGIEAALERRIGDETIIVAKANYQSDIDIEELTDLKLTLEYFSDEEPTHFYVSFSPSFDGGTFTGAIGSTLMIDDVKLIYE